MIIRIFRLWLKYRKDWDSLCNRCGKCCYIRFVDKDKNVIVDYNFPCEYLDIQSKTCSVYDGRFKKCEYCGKVNLFRALFNPSLPGDCGYVKTFRLWKNKE